MRFLFLFARSDKSENEEPAVLRFGYSHDKLNEAYQIRDEELRDTRRREIIEDDKKIIYETRRYFGFFKATRIHYQEELEALPEAERQALMFIKKNN